MFRILIASFFLVSLLAGSAAYAEQPDSETTIPADKTSSHLLSYEFCYQSIRHPFKSIILSDTNSQMVVATVANISFYIGMFYIFFIKLNPGQ